MAPEIEATRGAAGIPSLRFETIIGQRTDQEILRGGERGRRIMRIPLTRVDTSEAITDKFHATYLGKDISQKGQVTPITVRARILDEPVTIQGQQYEAGNVVYDIADGYHRSIAEQSRSAETIEASVLYGCTDEELLDLRILSAGSVESVQIPRIGAWVTKEFNETDFAQKDVSVLAAFEFATRNTKPLTRRIRENLRPDEQEELLMWVREKCDIWQKNPRDIFDILLIVKYADPELIKRIRQGTRKGRPRNADSDALSKRVVVAVSTEFGGESAYHVQKAILAAAKARGLSIQSTLKLIEKLSGHYRDQDTYEEVYGLAMSIDVQETVFDRGAKDTGTSLRHRQHSSGETTDEAEETTQELLSLKEENAGLLAKVAALEARVVELEEEAWWNTLSTLTPAERTIMRLHSNGTLAAAIAQEKITKEDALRLRNSAFAKRKQGRQTQQMRKN